MVFPTQCFVQSVAIRASDDTHKVSPSEAVIAAILDIREHCAAIGLTLARLHLVKIFSMVLTIDTLINSVRLHPTKV